MSGWTGTGVTPAPTWSPTVEQKRNGAMFLAAGGLAYGGYRVAKGLASVGFGVVIGGGALAYLAYSYRKTPG